VWPGATLLLYTDGLVERRRESIQSGLDRLRRAAVGHDGDLDGLCDHLLSTLVEGDRLSDDIALLAMRPASEVGGQLSLTLPAEPRMLAEIRREMRRWLRGVPVTASEESEILLACGEACANVVRHAYPAASGDVLLDASVADGTLEVTVSDHGRWRAPVDRGGGWGLQLIRDLVDTVDVEREPAGTVVRMRRRLQDAEGDE
jgi:anti-sigma regulatory factor (Ser/Thr protein kinase)